MIEGASLGAMNKAMGVTDQIPFITAGGSWIYFLDGFVLSTMVNHH